MTKHMSEKAYKEFRSLLYDFQEFKPDVVAYATSGPEHDHRLKMASHLEAFEKKHGSAHHLLVRSENMKDWSWYNEINKTRYHI